MKRTAFLQRLSARAIERRGVLARTENRLDLPVARRVRYARPGRKHPARALSQVKGAIGAVTAIGDQSIVVSAHGGQIEVFKLKYDGGKKIAASQFCQESGLSVGTILGA